MSLTSDASDVSDETEIPLTNGHTPSYYSNGCIPTSPTGSETPQSQFLFAPQNAQQTGSKMVKPLVSRQETTTSMRSHSSRVGLSGMSSSVYSLGHSIRLISRELYTSRKVKPTNDDDIKTAKPNFR